MEEKRITYVSVHYVKCTIFSSTNIKLSKINNSRSFQNGRHDYKDIEKLEVDISLEGPQLLEENMKEGGKKVSELLRKIPHIKALHLKFLQRPFAEYLFQYFIKEIKCHNISVLKVFFNDQLKCLYHNIPTINNSAFLKNFGNLRVVQIVVIYEILHSDIKELIDAVSVIKGVTIEIIHKYSFANVKECLYKRKCINNNSACICESKSGALDIISYVIHKKVYLSIPKTNPNLFNFIEVFPTMTTLDFEFLRKLHIKLFSYIELREFAEFLPHMSNLEVLSLHIQVNTDSMLCQFASIPHVARSKWVKLCPEMNSSDSTFFDNVIINESKSHSYKSFENLRKLKTIQLTLDIFNASVGHLVVESYRKNPPIVKKYKRLYHIEIFSFLSKAPRTVENLYLCRIPEFKYLSSYLLNEYFPNLTFLCLGEIYNYEKECLVNLKNLKIFVSHYKNVFVLPENVETCMLCINYYSSNEELQLNRELFSQHYKYLKHFTKEYTLNGSMKGKIFFNHYQDYLNIKRYFSDIEEMAFGK
uniref:F-box domain-containing protein n=1 Tax=Strongyloides venezuelensis TaxID=75913 RepID=A0A0K0FNE6_STRVS